MTADIGVEKPQPTWPIAVALGISGLLFFLYIYTLIAPIIRNPNIIAPYSTRQAGRSKRKSKSSWLSRWLLGAGTPRHLQPITPSQSRTSRRTANRDLESSPSSSTSHTHGYFPSSPSSAKLSPHPITRSHPSFQYTFNPSYNTLHTPLTPSFSTSPTGVRVSRLDYDLPSHTPHVRGGQHTLSPPPPAYVSSPNSPSPDYTPVFVEQTSGCTTPPMSPGTYPTRAPSAEGGASTMSYYSPSALASPSASSFYGTVSRSPSSHSFTSGLPPPSPSYNGSAAAPATLAVPPFTRGPVGRSISGSSTGSASSASMYSASSALHQSPPSSQDNPSPPPRQGHLDAAQATLREDGPAQKPPPRVLTKRGADKGQDNDTLEHFPLPPPLTIRTTNTGPYTPKITTSVSVHAVGSRTTQYWPPGSQLPTPPVSAAPSSESESYPHPPKPPQPSSPSFPTVNHPYSPPSPREIRESLSDSAIHTLTPERLARQPILAAHMYARNESGAPMVHLRATPTIRGTAGKM